MAIRLWFRWLNNKYWGAFMSIYQAAVKRPITTILIFVAIVILGFFSLINISTDLYPKIESSQIMVITSYSGAGAEDIENTVSRPIENALNSVSDVKHISSVSKDNFSTVTLEFEAGTDMEVATNDVRDKLDRIVNILPKEANRPMLFKFSSDDIPVMLIAVTANESRNGLNKIIEETITNPLARIQGVGTVALTGVPIREINVYCDPLKLEAYNLSVEQVAQAIQTSNTNVPIGTIDVGSMTSAIRLQGEFSNTQSLAQIKLASFNGREILLEDVATINDGNKERMQESFVNGEPGGLIRILKQSGANSVTICNRIKEALPELQKNLPSDVALNIVMDTSDNITKTINSLKETILITFIVVVIVVLFFLGRWRATFIIVLTIPISLVAAFGYLYGSGNTLNIISLSALSIAIGMVVDDAIVVLENITTHIERGSYPKQAAIFATNEVARSVIASTLTMLAVFLPLTLVPGFVGILFRQLGWVVSIVMIVSTVAALTLTPVLSSKMLRHTQRNSKAYNKIFGTIRKGLDKIDVAYAKLLNYAVRHRAVILVSAAAVFGLSLLLVPQLRTEFLPQNDSGYLSGSIEFPPGYNAKVAKQFAMQFTQQALDKYPDIDQFNFQVGEPDEDNAFAAFGASGSNVISMNVRLVPFEQRKHTTMEIADLLRKDLSKYPELATYRLIMGHGGGGQNNVQMEIYGYDIEKTNAVAQAFMEEIKQYSACSEASVSRKPSAPEYHVVFDETKLALYGLTKATAATALRNAINGTRTSYYREDGNEYAIRVRYAPEWRNHMEEIENILIRTPRGNSIRLSALGHIEEKNTPPSIERKDRERYVTIYCAIAKGHAMSELVDNAMRVMDKMDLPEGVTYKLGGEYETQQESFRSLFTLMLLIIILVFIVMAAEFESLVNPFVIMFSVPFAFSGVMLGLVITHTPMGVMALIGAIMLIGIVVKNGIVLIDYTILCRERGMSTLQSVVTAGRSRLRPVLMTTATTVLGMIPLAAGQGEGAEMWRSMGMTVAFGLTVSTLVTLVLVPTVYASFAGIHTKRKRRALKQRLIRKNRDAEHIH